MFLFSILVLSFVMVGCTSDKETSYEVAEPSENFNETGFPIVSESIEINMTGAKKPDQADWNEMIVLQEYAEKTGINVNFEPVPGPGWEEKRNLLLSSGDLPDAFFKAGLSQSDIVTYGSQGVFIPLNDLIDQYAPNIKAMFDEYPEIKKSVTAPDGNIYVLPQAVNYLAPRIEKPWINKTWLDNLGLEVPTTTDEYYQALKAFVEEDPNGNGQADELGYSGPPRLPRFFEIIRGSFGLGNAGYQSGNFDLDSDGNVRFYPIEEGYKQMLEYSKKMYEDGLIDEEIFVQNNNWVGKGQQGIVGSFIANNSLTMGDKVDDYVAMDALEGPNGDTLYSPVKPMVQVQGTFAITSENDYPAETIRWVDYFYGKEGSKMIRMGIEGETYEVKDNGELAYLDKILNNPDGMSFDQAIGQYTMWTGGNMPHFIYQESDLTGNSHPAALEGAEILKDNIPEDPWPPLLLTTEEQQRIAGIQTDIDTYVQEMSAKFVAGSEPLSNWDEYVSTIEQMGVEDYIEVMQAAYTRYKEAE